MAITDLIPWKKKQVSSVPVKRESESSPEVWRRDSETAFQLDRLFDEFWSGFGLTPFRRFEEAWSAFSPHLDVIEDDKEVRVSVELPGMDSQDFDVSLSHNVLTIRGEKKEEREQKGKSYYRMERSYGFFERSVPLPGGAQEDKIEATFNKGVLTVTVPKTVPAQGLKKIAVKAR